MSQLCGRFNQPSFYKLEFEQLWFIDFVSLIFIH